MYIAKTELIILQEFMVSDDPIKDLESYIKYNNIVYKPEKIDFTSKPWVTLIKKYGDCDDFAFLAKKILNKYYVNSYVLFLYNESFEYSGGHNVFVGKDKFGKLNVMSNGAYAGNYANFDELIKHYINSDCGYYRIL